MIIPCLKNVAEQFSFITQRLPPRSTSQFSSGLIAARGLVPPPSVRCCRPSNTKRTLRAQHVWVRMVSVSNIQKEELYLVLPNTKTTYKAFHKYTLFL